VGACINYITVRGYTLVELVTVLILVGILAAFVGPRFFDLEVFQARGFYDEALSILRYSQKTAIAQRRAVYVNLQPTAITACYTSSFPCSVADGVPGPYGEKPYSVQAGGGTSATPGTIIFFDALGRPYNASDIVPNSTFTANLTLTITGGGNTRTITVERETGYVR